MLHRAVVGLLLGASVLWLPTSPAGAQGQAHPEVAYTDFDFETGQGHLVIGDQIVEEEPEFAYFGVRWSPDGTQLAYSAGSFFDGTIDLYVMAADGATAPVDVAADAGGAVWSPDGTELAYSDSNGNLRVAEADGSGSRLLTSATEVTFDEPCTPIDIQSIFPVAWTPDGQTIVVGQQAYCLDIAFNEVAYVDAGSGALTRGVEASDAALSPDGSTLAIVRPLGGLDVGPIFGTDFVGVGSGQTPSWGPGATLAFVRNDDVWVAPDGGRGQPRQIESSDTLASLPRFSATGREVFFLGLEDPEEDGGFDFEFRTRVFVADGATGAVTQVSRPADQDVVDFDVRPAVTVQRLAGPDRYGTAVAIATSTFPNGATDAVLARGDDFADALASAGAAAAHGGGGPILLSPTGALPDDVAAALDELGVQRLVIAGDTGAVSAEVEAALRTHVPEVVRVAGPDRYETARQLAASTPGSSTTAIVASGERFPDALAAGPLASLDLEHIYLTQKDVVPQATIDGLREQGITDVVLVGGTDVVSPAVEAALAAIPVHVTRVAGATRFDTAALLADQFDGPITSVTLARGDTFPDAVAGAPLGLAHGAPTLFTDGPGSLGDATRAWLQAHAGDITTIRVLGDRDAVSDAVVAEALAAVGG